MNIQLLLFTAALSVFNLVNARPQQVPATPPPGQCVIQEEVCIHPSVFLVSG